MTDDISPKIATILIYPPEIAILYQGGITPANIYREEKTNEFTNPENPRTEKEA